MACTQLHTSVVNQVYTLTVLHIPSVLQMFKVFQPRPQNCSLSVEHLLLSSKTKISGLLLKRARESPSWTRNVFLFLCEGKLQGMRPHALQKIHIFHLKWAAQISVKLYHRRLQKSCPILRRFCRGRPALWPLHCNSAQACWYTILHNVWLKM